MSTPTAWTDEHTALATIRDELRRFVVARDWERYHSPRNLAMALGVEASELLELYLWSADDGPQPPVPERAPRVAEEAADVLITLVMFCDRAGVDLAAAVQAKIARNAEKYPADRAAGSLRKWDELKGDDPG